MQFLQHDGLLDSIREYKVLEGLCHLEVFQQPMLKAAE
jgi:hypothetical protein